MNDDDRCVEGGAWCAAVERAFYCRTIRPEPCALPGWLLATHVEPCAALLLPPSWGPSTTATPTHGRCGEA